MIYLKLRSYGAAALNTAREYMPSRTNALVSAAAIAAGFFARNFYLLNSQPPRSEICTPHSFLGFFDVPFLFNCVSKDEIDRIFSLAENVTSSRGPLSQIANTALKHAGTVLQNISYPSEGVDCVVNSTVSMFQNGIERVNTSAAHVFDHAASFMPEAVMQANATLASKAAGISNGLPEGIVPAAIMIVALALPYIGYQMCSKNHSVQTDSMPRPRPTETSRSLQDNNKPQEFRKKGARGPKSLRTNGARFISDFATPNRFDLSPKPVNPTSKTTHTMPKKAKNHKPQSAHQEQKTNDAILPVESIASKESPILPLGVQKSSCVFRDALRDGRTYAQVVDSCNVQNLMPSLLRRFDWRTRNDLSSTGYARTFLSVMHRLNNNNNPYLPWENRSSSQLQAMIPQILFSNSRVISRYQNQEISRADLVSFLLNRRKEPHLQSKL